MTNAISAQGLALIQQFEGFRAEPTPLPDGNWVVGHGHVRVGEAGAVVSASEAADLLSLDLAAMEVLVNDRVSQELNQSQFDALVSFAFSVGAEAFEQSQVCRRTNAGDFLAAACAMDAWRKTDVGGELIVVDALVHRRAAEKALYLKDLAHAASPSAFLRAKLDYAASVLGAPVTYTQAPEVGSILPDAPKPDAALRLVEILKSEPATEVLLLTQVVASDYETEAEDELVTAHAKPVARTLDNPPIARRRARGAPVEATKPTWFSKLAERLPEYNQTEFFETFGLAALGLFGLALVAVGSSLLFVPQVDTVSMAAAAAMIAPGVTAILIAVIGALRGPLGKPLGT